MLVVSVADGAIGIGAVFVCHHGWVEYVWGGHAAGWLVTGLAWQGASWLGAMSLKKTNNLVCYLGSMLASFSAE